MIAATVVAALACACADDKRETIAISADPETFPTMRTINVSTLISDSGYTRYHITTPLWLMFEEAGAALELSRRDVHSAVQRQLAGDRHIYI